MQRELVLVLDFGSQYTQLIARSIREHKVYCEIHPCTIPLSQVRDMQPRAIVLSGGPMLNGYWKGELCGSGMAVWKARQEMAAGRIDDKEFMDIAAASAPSAGHCNTMGTASTMNALAEALGMSLPGCAAIPAPYRERAQMAYDTGVRAVEIVYEDLKPSDILTRTAFENTSGANMAFSANSTFTMPGEIRQVARCRSGSVCDTDPERELGKGQQPVIALPL